MVRLNKFKEKKIKSKNIIISFAIIMLFMIVVLISKSYAIYKMQKEFDVIKSQIGTFTNGDVNIAVLVDGKETNEFPSYETNYKIESVECTNGVTGSFDVENWQVTIADMKATSTKCTVSFNSNETNEITPINMSKKDLIALNEEYQNVAYNNLKTQLLNDTYPVGSIYMSTEDDTVEKVQTKFGGTWVKYSSGTTLVGDDGTNYITNDSSKGSGGSKTVTLTDKNLPNHTHTTPSTNLNNGVAENGGEHTHHVYLYDGGYSGGITIPAETMYLQVSARLWTASEITNKNQARAGLTTAGGAHTHTVTGTIPAMTTNSCTNCSSSPINVESPYTVVYMYKRTA